MNQAAISVEKLSYCCAQRHVGRTSHSRRTLIGHIEKTHAGPRYQNFERADLRFA